MLAVLAMVPGCSGPREELRIDARLVSQRWGHAGDPSTVAVPTAAVGDEWRPVLASAPPASVFLSPLPAGGRRRSLTVTIPPNLRGGPVRLDAALVSPRFSVTRQKPRVTRATDGAARVRVALSDRLKDGSLYLAITARGAPEHEYTTAPLTVAPRARLRFGVGVDERVWSPDLPAVQFELTAIAGDRERGLFTTRLDPAQRPEERRWFDQEIDLAAYAGQAIRLRFTMESLGGRRAPFAYGVWSDPTIVVPTSVVGAAPRNLVLISLDTLRADRLGAYGYARPTSPEIDERLAAQGTVFTHAYSTYPGTGGSHASILTGLYPCAVVPDLAQPIHPRAATLAELLRAAGYETAAFTEDGYVIAAHGFARGFGSFVEGTSALVTEPTGQADKTFARALDWVRARRAPWFAFLHTYQVHHPYAPPPGYLDRVVGSGPPDASDSARYDAEIRYTDDLLAKFLAGLDQLGASHDTLVVLLADHGDQFGEHGLTLHGNSLYDDLLHVPLIVRAPGLVPAGLRIDMPVDMTDVVPTVLDLLRLPPLRWANGRSLVPLLRGASLPDRPLYASLVITRQVAVRVPPTKWIIDQATGRVHSYDLRDDARELHDLGASSPDIGAELLAKYRAACETLPASDVPAAPTLDPAVKDKLKALGYVD